MLVCYHLESHLPSLDPPENFFLIGEFGERVSVCVRVAVRL